MAVTFENHWKNIVEKLLERIRVEFSNNIPAFIGDDTEKNRTSQYFVLNPNASNLLEYNSSMETREYEIGLKYFYEEGTTDKNKTDYIMRIVSRLEAVVANNITMTLSDGTAAYNCKLTDCNFDTGTEEEPYTIEWTYTCNHSHLITES